MKSGLHSQRLLKTNHLGNSSNVTTSTPEVTSSRLSKYTRQKFNATRYGFQKKTSQPLNTETTTAKPRKPAFAYRPNLQSRNREPTQRSLEVSSIQSEINAYPDGNLKNQDFENAKSQHPYRSNRYQAKSNPPRKSTVTIRPRTFNSLNSKYNPRMQKKSDSALENILENNIDKNINRESDIGTFTNLVRLLNHINVF